MSVLASSACVDSVMGMSGGRRRTAGSLDAIATAIAGGGGGNRRSGAFHSITRVARTMTSGGTVSPSTLAVFRFTYFDRHGLALDVPTFLQTLAQRIEYLRRRCVRCKKTDPPESRLRLGTRFDWAEHARRECDQEFAPCNHRGLGPSRRSNGIFAISCNVKNGSPRLPHSNSTIG